MKQSKHEHTPERQLGWDMDKSSYLRAGAETGQNTDTPHEDQAYFSEVIFEDKASFIRKEKEQERIVNANGAAIMIGHI